MKTRKLYSGKLNQEENTTFRRCHEMALLPVPVGNCYRRVIAKYFKKYRRDGTYFMTVSFCLLGNLRLELNLR